MPPPPLRRGGVNSPHLPACRCPAPGDPAVIAPGEGPSRNFLSCPAITKADQSHQTVPVKDLVLQLQMVIHTFLLGFHTAEPHANPGVQSAKSPPSSEKPRRKVLSRTPDDSVEVIHQSEVEIELSGSEFPDLVFEFLHRLRPHAAGTAGQDKPQKGVTIAIGGHFRFLRAKLKLEPLF